MSISSFSVVAIIFFLFVFISLIAVLIIIYKQRQRAKNESLRMLWTWLARDLEFRYTSKTSDHGILEGSYEGVDVRIDIHGSDLKSNANNTTKLSNQHHNSLGLGLQLSSATSTLSAENHSIKTGDAAFDDAFIVDGDDRERITRFLDSDVRRQLLDMHGIGKLNLDDNELRMVLSGAPTKIDELIPVLQMQTTMAKTVQHAFAKVYHEEARITANAHVVERG